MIFQEYAYDQPLSSNSVESVRKIAQSLMRSFPRALFADELSIKDVEAMAFNVAQYDMKYVYEGNLSELDITFGQVPSTYYINSRWKLAQRMLALAGYRLADLMKEALDWINGNLNI